MKLYTLNEVAEIVRKDINTIYIHRRSGKLEANKVGGNWRVTQEQLDRYINGK